MGRLTALSSGLASRAVPVSAGLRDRAVPVASAVRDRSAPVASALRERSAPVASALRAGAAARPARSGPWQLPVAAVLGYLIGTTPSADVATRLATGGTVDLRGIGSGNPGGANASTVLGPRWGAVVIGADIAKGAVASAVGRAVAGGAGASVAGAASVVGHCFPVWKGGRGGKGVSASVGQCLATFPAYFPIDLGVAAMTSTARWRGRAEAATLVSSVLWVMSGALWWRRRWPNLWGPEPTVVLPLANLASSLVIAYRFWTVPNPTLPPRGPSGPAEREAQGQGGPAERDG
ncbi:MAG: glycerol-3-phosphate acyltransferase [Acidimicrobiales bacterium]